MSTQIGQSPFETILEGTLKAFSPYWQRFFSPTINFGGNKEDIHTEQHVLQKAGSYGKQLGIIIKVLDIWVDHDLPSKLTPEEQLAVAELRCLSHEVQRAVEAMEGPKVERMTTAINNLIASLDEMTAGVQRAVEAMEGPKVERMTTAIDNLIASLDEIAATDQRAYQWLVERLQKGIDAHK